MKPQNQFVGNISLVGTTKAMTIRSVIDLILPEFLELKFPKFPGTWSYRLEGKNVVGICAYKHHLGIPVSSPRVIGDLRVELGTGGNW